MGYRETRGGKPNLLIHLHMPKTGGTTLKKIIKKNYPPSITFDVYDRANLDNILNDLSTKKVKCIQGHMPFGVHEYFSQSSTYITLLRDPVDRVISEYYFIRSIPSHSLHETVSKMALKEFQEEERNKNAQTRYILGSGIGKTLTADDLAEAKQNLQDYFSIVGITEMFNESVFLMGREFGWKHVNYRKKNVTKNRPSKAELSENLIEKMKENNELDIELYKFGKQLLEEKLNQLTAKEKLRLQRYNLRNRQ
jgi:hypothetical protein